MRAYDTIYVEAIQPAHFSRRPEPKQDENGHYAHTGASRKAGLNKSIHDAGWRHFLNLLAAHAQRHGGFRLCMRAEATDLVEDAGRVVGVRAITPAHVFEFVRSNLAIKALAVDVPTISRPLGIITLKNRTLTPAAQLFIDCAREVAKSLTLKVDETAPSTNNSATAA